MLTREYGKTGEKISVIGFGGMRFPDPRDIDANASLVLHAYRRGINYFDTAPFYCKDKSEDIIGAAVRRMNRKRVYLSTKCMEADGAKLRKSLEKSLKRLNTSYIDFFHIWCIVNPDQWKQRKKGGAVAAAMKAKDEGLIRHLAVSSHLPGKDLGKLLAEGVFEGVTLGYCALNFPYRQKALDAAAKMHLGVVTMNRLACWGIRPPSGSTSCGPRTTIPSWTRPCGSTSPSRRSRRPWWASRPLSKSTRPWRWRKTSALILPATGPSCARKCRRCSTTCAPVAAIACPARSAWRCPS